MPEILDNTVITKNMPNLKVGDVVEIRSWTEIQREAQRGMIDCGWNTDMKYLSGKRFTITDDVFHTFRRHPDGALFYVDGYAISASMLKVIGEEAQSEQPVEEDNKYSLHNKRQSKDVIEEMISKVDRVRFKKLLCVASCDRSVTMKTISDSIVDKYLINWAKAKYDLYLLFGKQLTVSKQIETEISPDTMMNKVMELQIAFPQYANLLGAFSPYEFIRNKCDGSNHVLKRVYDKYTDDTKLSKVLTGMINDKSFSDALGMLFSQTTIKAMLTLSIDPFDYLTMSVNRYDWTSCQRIGDIEAPYGTGAGSIMLDEGTIIAFAHSGKDVMYRMRGMEFSGNSKFWRECMYVDKESGNFVTSREYPSAKDLLSEEARLLLENIIADYLNIENKWVVVQRGTINYHEGSKNLYHDIAEGHYYREVKIKGSDKKTSVSVGKNIFCVKCGKVIREHWGRYVCDNCFEYENSVENDDVADTDIPF